MKFYIKKQQWLKLTILYKNGGLEWKQAKSSFYKNVGINKNKDLQSWVTVINWKCFAFMKINSQNPTNAHLTENFTSAINNKTSLTFLISNHPLRIVIWCQNICNSLILVASLTFQLKFRHNTKPNNDKLFKLQWIITNN